MEFDYIIVGAGIAGLVLAERFCSHGKRCLIVDRRGHIGGNCFDQVDTHGQMVHCYGPHYFRTNSAVVREYLSRFTKWTPCTYKVMVWTHGRYWSFPVNLRTYEQLIGRSATEIEFVNWLERERQPIANPANSREMVLSQMGQRFYELFFEGYSRKQWGCDPAKLAPAVCARIPFRTNRNDAYLVESFQAIPSEGYHAMFLRMIEACGANAVVELGLDYRTMNSRIESRRLFYCGPIDEYYNHRFGPLPYRSLRFESTHYTADELARRSEQESGSAFWQPALQINYPNDYAYTRTVELKHIVCAGGSGTTVVREYPASFEIGGEPYYPVPSPESALLYESYRRLAEKESHITFCGRLGTYRYLNMDQVVAHALSLADATLREAA